MRMTKHLSPIPFLGGFGKNLMHEDYQAAVTEMKVFKEFVLEEVTPIEPQSPLVFPVNVTHLIGATSTSPIPKEVPRKFKALAFSSLVLPSLILVNLQWKARVLTCVLDSGWIERRGRWDIRTYARVP